MTSALTNSSGDEVWQVNYDDLAVYEEIGSGQFGKVFKADYFGATVGVKKVNNDPGQDKLMLKMIQREVEILKYNHPNIVTLIGVAEHDNDLYLVTEYCEAGDLCKYLRDPQVSIPWPVRARMASDIASAMAFLHAKHITHRDLKSQNCLVTENWRIKLCDFGFARKVTTNGQPAYMTLCGTDDFMSPEIILGEDYDERSDIFSFGLLLCEIIIRKRICDVLPRTPATYFGVEEKMFWSQIPKDCPPALSQLAWHCCAYYPKDRPSFKEIMTRVRALERELNASSPTNTAPTMEPPHLEANKKKVQTERKLIKCDSVPITVEASVVNDNGGDFGPEPSPRRKKDKQAVLKQLVEEFFKRTKQDKLDKEEKRHIKEEKRLMKEEKRQREEEEKRQREEEKRQREEERRQKEQEEGLAKSPPRKSFLKFSAEIPMEEEKEGGGEEEVKKTKLAHRLSMTLSGGFGGNAEKRAARRSIALGKPPLGEVTMDATTTNH